MNQLKLDAVTEYQKMVDLVFGKGSIRVSPATVPSNNVIMTWSDLYNFEMFRGVFLNRLSELKNKFPSGKNASTIHNLVQSMADDKNWSGAYAELVAYNILHNNMVADFCIDETRDAAFSLARHMVKKDGKPRSNTNYDVFLPYEDVYMDVKAFTDTVGIILNDSVIKYVCSQDPFKDKKLSILPQYPLDDSEEKYQPHIKALQDELAVQLNQMFADRKSAKTYNSEHIRDLSFNISLGRFNSRESAYHPYRRAAELKDMIVKRYCDKLPIDNPFFLVFVNFPWYNQVDSDVFDFNRILYRSIARRTFIQYQHTDVKIQVLNPLYVGGENASEAAQLLTGIIFIDDNSVKEGSYNAYIYLNPTAKNKRATIHHYLEEILRNAQNSDYDDFLYDNY